MIVHYKDCDAAELADLNLGNDINRGATTTLVSFTDPKFNYIAGVSTSVAYPISILQESDSPEDLHIVFFLILFNSYD